MNRPQAIEQHQLKETSLGNMQSTVQAGLVRQGTGVFNGGSEWDDLAQGLAAVTQKYTGYLTEENARKQEAELKKQEEADRGRAVQDVAKQVLEGKQARHLTPESGSSAAYQEEFAKTQWSMAGRQLKEQLEKDTEDFFKNPETALTMTPEAFRDKWAKENDLESLTQDKHGAAEALKLLYSEDQTNKILQIKKDQDEMRFKMGVKSWTDNMFEDVVSTKGDKPDLWAHEAKAKALNIPEKTRYVSMMDSLTSGLVDSKNLAVHKSLEDKGPEGLTLRQVIMRSGSNEAIESLKKFDKTFDDIQKETRKKFDEDAMVARELNRQRRRSVGISELFNTDGTPNLALINEPITDPTLSPDKQLAAVEENWKAVNKALNVNRDGEVMAAGASSIAGIPHQRQMDVVNATLEEALKVDTENARKAGKQIGDGEYDMTNLASTILAYSQKEPAFLRYKPWVDTVQAVKGTAPVVFDDATGSFKVADTWQPVVASLLTVMQNSSDDATARANVLKVTGDDTMTDMLVKAHRVSKSGGGVSFSEALYNVFNNEHNPDNIKNGTNITPPTSKELAEVRNVLAGQGMGIFSRAYSSIFGNKPVGKFNPTSAEQVLGHVTRTWYERNVNALKPQPFSEFAKQYMESEWQNHFVFDGVNYVKIPTEFSTPSKQQREDIELAFGYARNKVEVALKKANKEFNSVELVPMKENSGWYNIYVDGRPSNFEPIPMGDVKVTRVYPKGTYKGQGEVKPIGGDKELVTYTKHGLLTSQLQRAEAIRSGFAKGVKGSAFGTGWSNEFLAKYESDKAVEAEYKKQLDAYSLQARKTQDNLTATMRKLDLPSSKVASIKVGDPSAPLLDLAYSNPGLALAYGLEGSSKDASQPDLMFSSVDNDKGATLPLGINLKHQDDKEIRQHLRSIGFADKEAQDNIISGKRGLTRSQSAELFQLVYPKYQQKAKEGVEKLSGYKWEHLAPNQQAAITHAYYNGWTSVGDSFVKHFLVDNTPEKFAISYETTVNGKTVRTRNTQMEDGLKSMFKSAADFLVLAGVRADVNVSSPKRIGGVFSDVPKQPKANTEVRLPNGQKVPPPPTNMSLPPLVVQK